MKKTTIYFIFSDTGTNLSRIINYCTKQSLNHVSIGFDRDLTEVYSFGRTQPRNPFSGGFVCEDIRSEFLKNANAAIYSFELTEAECKEILRHIKEIETEKDHYRYNFMGLIGILLRIEIKRKRAFFCSEFVATVVSDADSIKLSKPTYFTTPSDIREEIEMHLIYQGRLGDYQRDSVITERKILMEDPSATKPSFMFLLSKKVKQFVIR